mmetsp:Transcript_258/g.492  ORF Transcript_258/g.492 Transcript_258/m.492 type:complete len:421 (+) Transcript_258:66-1328(+)
MININIVKTLFITLLLILIFALSSVLLHLHGYDELLEDGTHLKNVTTAVYNAANSFTKKYNNANAPSSIFDNDAAATSNNNPHAIPKIIHQEWKTTDLPYNLRLWRDECIRINAPDGWEFKLWTKEDNLNLIKEHYPELLGLYNGYNQGIKRIDMIRFVYLHKFGGVYMDLDITCLKPFQNFFDDYPNKFLLVNQYKRQREYTNAVMASPPNHSIFNTIFAQLPRHANKNIIEAAGGIFLQSHVLEQPETKGLWIGLPFDIFYAQDWLQGLSRNNVGERGLCYSFDNCRTRFPYAMTVHMQAGTWASKDGDASNRKWENSTTLPMTNFTLTPELASHIVISGEHDKDFCYKCPWRPGTTCSDRLAWLMEHYNDLNNINVAVEKMVEKLPQCRTVTIIPDNNDTTPQLDESENDTSSENGE